MKGFNLFIILIFTCSLAHSQNREVYPQQVSIEHNEAIRSFSSDYMIMQSKGAEEMAENAGDAINISSISIQGLENLISLLQDGHSNTLLLDVIGSQNEGDFEQIGNYNLINIDLIGSQNNFGVAQKGNNNAFEGTFNINNQSLGTFSQIGNYQDAQIMGQNGIPLSITQTGQGTSLIIRNY